jgi:glycerol-3-phosphate acyltransferase PlsY
MLWLLVPLSFLIGSIPFGLLLGKAKGIDIREHGSGNIGSTNVFRTLGKKSGIFCLILDVLKGFLPVFLTINLCRIEGTNPLMGVEFLSNLSTALPKSDQFLGQSIQVLSALAAILGHNYSPWIGFKGGKGIATTGGALIALMPAAVVILILIFIIVTRITKYVSLGSIATGIALPIITGLGSYYHIQKGDIAPGSWNKPLFIFSLVAGILAIWKHRTNVARLRAGTEHRIGQKKNASPS